jgi:hypothetical protein
MSMDCADPPILLSPILYPGIGSTVNVKVRFVVAGIRGLVLGDREAVDGGAGERGGEETGGLVTA